MNRTRCVQCVAIACCLMVAAVGVGVALFYCCVKLPYEPIYVDRP